MTTLNSKKILLSMASAAAIFVGSIETASAAAAITAIPDGNKGLNYAAIASAASHPCAEPASGLTSYLTSAGAGVTTITTTGTNGVGGGKYNYVLDGTLSGLAAFTPTLTVGTTTTVFITSATAALTIAPSVGFGAISDADKPKFDGKPAVLKVYTADATAPTYTPVVGCNFVHAII